MDTGSSPSASPPPITPPNRVDFGFGFGFHFPAHGSAALKPGGRHAVVSCAHTVLCCAMCGVRVVRTMCEMGVQAQVDEDADESNSVRDTFCSVYASCCSLSSLWILRVIATHYLACSQPHLRPFAMSPT